MSQMIKDIKEKLEQIPKIKVVSFDIFDTLLFRTVVIPDRVFWLMYRKKTKIFPAFTTVGDWVSSRKMAEQEARRVAKEKYGNSEVSLEDIYHYLPTAYANIEELMQLELECECMVGVLNSKAVELLQYLKQECEKDIVLTSDMYLNAGQLAHILQSNGLDLNLITKIYVSADAKCSKKEGKLFQLVLEEQCISPDEMLHIGDNIQSDVVAAQREGIWTYYYDFISGREFRYPFLLWERELYAAPLCEGLFLTRLLAGRDEEVESKENSFFFIFGKMLMGPFFTCATEWVLDEAKRNDIRIIRPFMREGKFLSRLLCAAAEERNMELSIEPLYISRVAAYASRFGELSSKEILTLMSGANVTLRDVACQLQIEELIYNVFEEYVNIPLTELRRSFDMNGRCIFDKIYDYLCDSKILQIVHQRNHEKKDIFAQYLQQMGLTKPAITLDIGWNGTTMNAVYRAINDMIPAGQLHQLLFCCSRNVAQNAVNGCVIKGFVGNYGGLQGKFNRIFIPIFEMFSLCEEGPTIGYKYEGERIIPITDKNIYSKEWIENIKEVQHGIMVFQKEYFEMRKMGKLQIDVKAQSIQALSMVERVFAYPLLQEVLKLGTAELDQNIGIDDRAIPVLEEELLSEYQKLGMEYFYMLYKNRQRSITWYQAFQTIHDPLFYLQMNAMQNTQYGKYATISLTKYVVKTVGNGKFVLVYCETDTAQVMTYLKAMGALDRIAGIVCTDEGLEGIVYNGIKILSYKEEFDTSIYFIPTREQCAYNEIKNKMMEIKSNRIKIIGHYEKSEVIFGDE